MRGWWLDECECWAGRRPGAITGDRAGHSAAGNGWTDRRAISCEKDWAFHMVSRLEIEPGE